MFLCYRPLLFHFIYHVIGIKGWGLLIFKTTVAMVTGFIALLLYSGMSGK